MVEFDSLTPEQKLTLFPVLENVDRFNMLIHLNNGGPMRHRELAEKSSLDTKTYLSNINKLMAVKLISPCPYSSDYQDTMNMRIEITPLGLSVFERFCEYQ